MAKFMKKTWQIYEIVLAKFMKQTWQIYETTLANYETHLAKL